MLNVECFLRPSLRSIRDPFRACSKLPNHEDLCKTQMTMTEITQMLQAVGRGESGASEELLPLVYNELRQLAAVRMAQEVAGQTLQPTAVVHEVWLRLAGKSNQVWQSRAHFFGAASEAMRRILIENARRKSRLKRGGGQARLNIEDLDLAQATPDDKILLMNGLFYVRQ